MAHLDTDQLKMINNVITEPALALGAFCKFELCMLPVSARTQFDEYPSIPKQLNLMLLIGVKC